MAETIKSHARRAKEGWFDRYATETMPGIDIGCGDDPLNSSFRQWEKRDGDATHMAGLCDDYYFTVYASHILEHLSDPLTALRNWYRILAPGGHLIVCVPHRDMYEKRKRLPSRWNDEHKSFWLPRTGEPPDTRGLWETVSAALPNAMPVSVRILDDGFEDRGEDVHSTGEFSIEMIVRKPC